MPDSPERDPREVLAAAPMAMPQVLAVATTVGLMALDGFDVLSISFASPGIAAEWGIDRSALGIVLSMELIGMSIGSIYLGGVADRRGRRPTILGCLALMTIGMFMATTASGIFSLCAWRVATGVGIGGVLASINAVAAEFSNARWRHLAVSLMAMGYPIGAVIGGLIAQQLLVEHSWRAVFYFGTIATACFIPIVLALMPESVLWLARRQPVHALARINHTLTRLGHQAIAALPAVNASVRSAPMADILSERLRLTTLFTTLAYFFHITTFYFILKWIPKIVVDMGFAPSAAAGVLVWANVGGLLGSALFTALTGAIDLKRLTLATFVCSAAAVWMFGRSASDLHALSMISAVAGFCTNAGIIGLFAIFAHVFPTEVRATGTGFVIGMGRGGAILSPIAAGFLFTLGSSLPTVAAVMACGSLVAFAALSGLSLDKR